MDRIIKNLDRRQAASGWAKKMPHGGVLLVILLLTLVEFCVDWATPLGIMDWLWYFAPLLLSVQMGSRIFPYLLSAVITALIFIDWYFSPAGMDSHLALAGRCMGACVLWVGAALISDRVRKEEEFLEAGKLNALVLADQLDTVCRFTADGTFLYVNDFFCYFFGKKREDLIGQKWHPLPLPDDVLAIEAHLRELSPSNSKVIIEFRMPNGVGELRWMQFIIRANFDTAGRMVELQSVGRDVTDRRQAEEALRESEQRFRQLAENIQEIFWLFDVAQNRILYISPNYEKLWGRTCAALYANAFDWAEAVHPEDRERVLAAVKKQAAENYQEEYRIVLPDGTVRWTRGRAFPIRDAAGRTQRIVGVHEDTTRRKQRDEAFQRSQENYRNLAESSPDAIFIFDRELKINYANRSAAGWLGKFPAELVGRACADFFSPESALEYEASLRLVLDSGKPLNRERKTALPGVEKIVETRLLALRDQAGAVISVMAISRDITEQRQAEQLLQRRERWSRELIDCMRDGFFRVDFQGKIREVNEAYCRMSGYSREELLTMDISQISLTDLTQEQVLQRIMKAVRSGSERFETRHRRKDGTAIHVETVITYLEMEGEHILALMRDITDRKQMEQEVLKISAHERQRIGYDLHDGLGQHLAGVAFKTKVLEENLLAVNSPESAAAREIVGLVNQAIAQTRGLARSLAPVEVEMNGLIAALQNLATETRCTFPAECRFHSALQDAQFDSQTSTMLYRIAQEAIHNALKHGGAEVIEMELSTAADGRTFLAVRDDGKGFSLEACLTKGMGMRIMRYRANSLGGELQIRSEPGKGTEIQCLLRMEPVKG